MLDLIEARANLERRKGARDSLVKKHEDAKKELSTTIKDLEEDEEAHKIIKEEARETQSELEVHVNEMATKGLSSVFDDPYDFKLEFVLRRDKTEADLSWEREGFKYLPTSGGVRDITSVALRTAFLRLPTKPGAPLLLLDEPAKNIRSIKILKRTDKLFADISKARGIQIIMVSYTDAIKSTAQKYFEVVKDNNTRVSTVFEKEQEDEN